ncbi:MAG TPA: 3-oxoacyl-[acyl-carrier-protein] synthase III C-terminal domain-containing protein [Myxococcota bacterium]|nr:3-oxoacyl-[acyl-carrier-protein] synthase III C-terminal domain-containing protein [Myxococcota bacterium]
MVGITSFGAYIPRYRLPRKLIFEAMGWYNPFNAGLAKGEKSVANYDEDSITMAVAAGMDCLCGRDPAQVAAFYLASTSLPYQERQNATIVSAALDLPSQIRTADVTGKLSAGSTALLSAMDSVKSGSVSSALVCAADTRLARMGSGLEHVFADGAAAMLIGGLNVIAEFVAAHSVSYDFVDHRRAAGEKFDRTWEERWIRDAGLMKIVPEALAGVLAKTKIDPQSISKLVIPIPVSRAAAQLAKGMGFKPEAVQDNLMAAVGDCGTAYPLLLLAAAVEDAKPGDKILMVSIGSGAEALIFEVTQQVEKARGRMGVKGHIEAKAQLDNYQKYCVFRDMVPMEKGIRAEIEPPTAFSTLWRERKTVLGLYGSRCKACGAPQFPPQRICANPACGAVDEMEPYCFAGRQARVFTYTADMLAFSVSPPAIYGIVDFEGGGRMWLDFTDCDMEDLSVDMPMNMSFRRKYLDRERGTSGYFWKAVPHVGA